MSDSDKQDLTKVPSKANNTGWLLALLGVGLLPWAPLLFGQALLQRDLLRLVWPARAFFGQTLRAGHFPFWYPSIGLGVSAFADPQLGVFYPPHLLFALTDSPTMVTAFSLLHLLAGGLGMFFLARALGARGVGAFIAGVAWQASGFTLSESTAGFRLLADAYMPWMAFSFLRLARSERALANTAGAASIVGLTFLVGEYFMATIALVFAGLFALAVVLTEAPQGKRWRAALVTVLRLGSASVLGLALAALALVPSLYALAETPRAHELPRAVAEGWSVHPGRLIEFMIPRVFGVTWMTDALSSWVERYFGGATPLSLSIYVGAAVVLLVAQSFAGQRRLVAVILGVGLLGLLLALGRHTPVHHVWRMLVPPLAHARYPEKYLVIVVFALALGAGLGAGVITNTRRLVITVGALVAIIAICAVAACSLFDCALAPALRKGAVHAGLVLTIAAGALAIRHHWPLGGNLLLALVVAGDLVFAARGLLRFQPYSGPPALAQAMMDGRPSGFPPTRFYRGQRVHDSMARAGAIPSDAVALASLRDNVSVVWGLSIMPGYNAGFSPRLTRLMDTRRPDLPRLFSADFALISLAGHAPPSFVPVTDTPGARLYAIEKRLPRIYAAAAARIESDNADLFAEDILEGKAVVLPAPLPQPLATEPAQAGVCEMMSFSANRIEARCRMEQSGVIVFVEQYARGWQATLDGRPTPVLRANSVMRAIWAPAGEHDVALTFHPPGLRLGLMISIFAVLTLAFLLISGRQQRAQAEATGTAK